MKRLILTCAVLAAAAVPLPAADAPKFDAAAAARLLAPFLDDQVVAVARLDAAAIDVDAVAEKLARFVGQDAGQLAEPRRRVRDVLALFTRAGGRDAYAVVSLADLPHPGPFVLVPVGEGANAARMVQQLKGALPFETVDELGPVVFAGAKATRERLRGLTPRARPDLAAALAATAGSQLQVAVVPGDDQRRVLEELAPRLPKELGGGAVTTLTRGGRWVAFGASFSPKLSAALTVQAKDAEAARALAELVTTGLRAVRQSADARAALPAVDDLAAALTPKVEGDRLRVTLDEGDTAVAKTATSALERVRAAAGRSRSMNNLKQIGLAMHNYADVHKGSLPPAYSVDKAGKPLLSWRVHILPYLEQDALYKQFKLDEPWDSEHNRKLIAQIPPTYVSPAQKVGGGKTTYVTPRADNTLFPPGGKRVAFKEITDGTTNTIMVVEAGDEAAVEWTKPDDLLIDATNPLKGLLGHYPEGFVAGMGDGSVRMFPRRMDAKTLAALFTRNGGEAVNIP